MTSNSPILSKSAREAKCNRYVNTAKPKRVKTMGKVIGTSAHFTASRMSLSSFFIVMFPFEESWGWGVWQCGRHSPPRTS